MRWIEIIQLRTTGASAVSALAEELDRALEGEAVGVAIYRHAAVETDLSVHLVHETDGDVGPDRALGQRLVATLGEHGLVNHSLWVEVRPSDRRPS